MIPSYDPHTQKLITFTDENGETSYTVESYSVEEMNDGSEWYVTFFKDTIAFRLKLIDTQVLSKIPKSDVDGLAAVETYRNMLISISDFPPGFYLPVPPTIKNVNPLCFVTKVDNKLKFKNTMDITTL